MMLRLVQAAWEGGQQWIERLVEEEGIAADARDNVRHSQKFPLKVAMDRKQSNGADVYRGWTSSSKHKFYPMGCVSECVYFCLSVSAVAWRSLSVDGGVCVCAARSDSHAFCSD